MQILRNSKKADHQAQAIVLPHGHCVTMDCLHDPCRRRRRLVYLHFNLVPFTFP